MPSLRKLSFALILVFIQYAGYCQKALHIYGGQDHDIYLGCLNCSDYNSNSIWNDYGKYGNEYSQTSPFNSYASYPPVIVDIDGNFYGYFTINENHPNRADFALVNIIYQHFDVIRNDVSKWHDKIFQ